MIELVPMSDSAFAEWAPHMWASYRADLLRSGLSDQEADENVERNRSTTMPDGVPLPGQYILEVHEGGTRIGVLWLAERGTDWFGYDFEIDEAHRGKGLGRPTMAAAEQWIRERGGTTIALSVFGFNDVAQHLYRSAGFEVVSMSMMKHLA